MTSPNYSNLRQGPLSSIYPSPKPATGWLRFEVSGLWWTSYTPGGLELGARWSGYEVVFCYLSTVPHSRCLAGFTFNHIFRHPRNTFPDPVRLYQYVLLFTFHPRPAVHPSVPVRAGRGSMWPLHGQRQRAETPALRPTKFSSISVDIRYF